MDIKICGLTNVEDARQAHSLGVDYLGFVFAPQSSRYVTVSTAAKIIASLHGNVRAVGVFVNETPARVLAIAEECGLWGVQLHGDEQSDAFEGFSLPIWRAIRVADGLQIPDPCYWKFAQKLVVDAYEPGKYGGTGRLADWAAARQLARVRSVVLAGGLTPEHVAAAVAAVEPDGVDVSSGVEAEPGRKDKEKLKRFVEEARAAGQH